MLGRQQPLAIVGGFCFGALSFSGGYTYKLRFFMQFISDVVRKQGFSNHMGKDMVRFKQKLRTKRQIGQQAAA